MKFFVKAKAWQLFLIVFGGMVPGYVIFATHEVWSIPSLQIVFVSMAAGLTWAYVWIFGWLWSLGMELNRRMPVTGRRKTRLFRLALTCVVLYLVVFMSLFVAQTAGNLALSKILFVGKFVLCGIAFFASVAWCYVMYFVTKALSRLPAYRGLTRLQYVGLFLLVWVFPLGMWFVQPRVNALFASDEAVHT